MRTTTLLTAAAVLGLFMTAASAKGGGGAAGASGHGSAASGHGVGSGHAGFVSNASSGRGASGHFASSQLSVLGRNTNGFARLDAPAGAGRFTAQFSGTRGALSRFGDRGRPGMHWRNPDARNVSNGGPSGTGDETPIPFVDGADAVSSCSGVGVIDPPASNKHSPVVIYGSASPCAGGNSNGPGIYYMQ
jgi:hypothetical protein